MNPEFLEISQVEELYKHYGIRYLKRTDYPFALTPGQSSKSPYYLDNQQDFQELNEKYREDILSSRISPCRVAFLGDHLNYGLFSTDPLKPGDFMAEYTGRVQKALRHKKMTDPLGGYSTDYAWTFPVRKGLRSLELDGRLQGNETRFINHSFEPNLSMEHCLIQGEWILFLIAHREIEAGEQLTVNYGEEYWTGGKRELLLI